MSLCVRIYRNMQCGFLINKVVSCIVSSWFSDVINSFFHRFNTVLNDRCQPGKCETSVKSIQTEGQWTDLSFIDCNRKIVAKSTKGWTVATQNNQKKWLFFTRKCNSVVKMCIWFYLEVISKTFVNYPQMVVASPVTIQPNTHSIDSYPFHSTQIIWYSYNKEHCLFGERSHKKWNNNKKSGDISW